MNFRDLVDIGELQELCDGFTRLTGAVTAILDLEGSILVASGWQPVCTQFHRANPATAQRCLESDTVLAGQLSRGESYNVYRCRNGLVDVAVPISIGGEHMANFFTGQFFFEPPDRDLFERQAAEFGFDPQPYLQAVANTPVFSPEQVRRMMDFLARLAKLIGETGLARLRLQEANSELSLHRDQLEEVVRQRTVELVQAKEAAETASRAKTAFLANMSHELRTPLNAITGMAYLVRHSGVNAQQADQLDRIDAASWHLLRVIDAILDLAKIEAGKFDLNVSFFDPKHVVRDVVSMIGEAARAKRLRLCVEMDWAGGLVSGDRTRVCQALLNLASNAVKFTESGQITLRVSSEQDDAAGTLMRFAVQDTGVGIPADQLERLFGAFEQADNSLTRPYGGAGLGLAITRRLAALMGGSVGVVSEPGRGSTFWFTARLTRDVQPTRDAAEDDGMPPKAVVVPGQLAGRHILLVEDDEINRVVALELLSQTGATVDAAVDGVEAVERAAAHAYDLILMDIQMPRLSGLDAARQIRALPGRANVPILAMTANALAEERAVCEAAGMDDFIGKPVDPRALVAKVADWLDRAAAGKP
ncbi:PocR ligand-binding domain-containing protein [Methylolobus aquaticus]